MRENPRQARDLSLITRHPSLITRQSFRRHARARVRKNLTAFVGESVHPSWVMGHGLWALEPVMGPGSRHASWVMGYVFANYCDWGKALHTYGGSEGS